MSFTSVLTKPTTGGKRTVPVFLDSQRTNGSDKHGLRRSIEKIGTQQTRVIFALNILMEAGTVMTQRMLTTGRHCFHINKVPLVIWNRLELRDYCGGERNS